MILKSTAETEAFGLYLGEKLKAYDVLALIGDLGTGKTTFVKALAKGMGLTGDVTSATFAILNIYEGDLPLYHFDVYRLKDEDEFFDMGGEDLLDSGAVCAVEWANIIEDSLPEDVLQLEFKRVDENTREITAKGFGPGAGSLKRRWRPMKILAFDTATMETTCALVEDEKVVAEASVNSMASHSEGLINMIQDMLDRADWAMEDLDLIAAGVGPGSFTGLRISVVLAKVFARSLNIPVVGVSTLKALAREVATDGVVIPLFDARRERVYAGVFEKRAANCCA